MRRGSLLVPLVLAGCPDPSTGDDEVGEDGDSSPGPSGPGCEENWILHDGEPLADSVLLPEYEPVAGERGGELVEFHQQREIASQAPRSEVKRVEVDGKPMPYEEFVDRHARRWGSGWIVESDQYLTDAQLEAAYQRYVAARQIPSSGETTPALLSLNNEGIDEVWSPPRKLALTWCVGTVYPLSWAYPGAQEDHDENYTKIVRAMESAARAWERSADVNFVHLREFDDADESTSGACQPGQNGIWFRVLMSNCGTGCFGQSNATPVTELESKWATPENPDGDERELWLWWPAVGSNIEMRITARHELGHVLGFEHEHERFELDDPFCNNDDGDVDIDWRSVTPADPFSVMGYDTCEGIAQNQPRLSPYDRVGAFYQYTWARRHSLMMGGGGSLENLAYDGSGRTGIAWLRSWDHEIEVWTADGPPGQPLHFDVDHQCLSGAELPCAGDITQSARIRPSPLFASGTDADIDVLLFGAGDALDDALLTNTAGTMQPSLLPIDGDVVPIIGSFEHAIDDEILLYRPGPAEDAVVVFGPNGEVSSLP